MIVGIIPTVVSKLRLMVSLAEHILGTSGVISDDALKAEVKEKRICEVLSFLRSTLRCGAHFNFCSTQHILLHYQLKTFSEI